MLPRAPDPDRVLFSIERGPYLFGHRGNAAEPWGRPVHSDAFLEVSCDGALVLAHQAGNLAGIGVGTPAGHHGVLKQASGKHAGLLAVAKLRELDRRIEGL